MDSSLRAEVVLLILYSTIYLLIILSYVATTVINRRNFYLVARHPRLLWIGLVLNGYISLSYGKYMRNKEREAIISDDVTIHPIMKQGAQTSIHFMTSVPPSLLSPLRLSPSIHHYSYHYYYYYYYY